MSNNPTLCANGFTFWDFYNGMPSSGLPVPNTIIEFTLNDDFTVSGGNTQLDGLGSTVRKTYSGKYWFSEDRETIHLEINVEFSHGARCVYRGTASEGNLRLTTTFVEEGGPFSVGDYGRVEAKIKLKE
jgi:hypothetical protein